MFSKSIRLLNVYELPNRINRVKYLVLHLIYNCFLYALILFSKTLISPILILVAAIIMTMIAVMSLLVIIKRLHDFNCSGWFILLMFVPIIGWIWGLIIFVIPGSKGENRFGPMPDEASTLENLIALLWIPALLLIICCFALMLR